MVATQVVEDGRWSSLVVCGVSCAWRHDELIFFLQPYYVLSVLIFRVATYLSLDVGLSVTQAIGAPSNPPDSLQSISLFVVLNMWPDL